MSGTGHQNAGGLTRLQKQWLDQMHRFAQEGGTMVDYAERYGLKLKQCYDWRCRLRKIGLLESMPSQEKPAFRRVEIGAIEETVTKATPVERCANPAPFMKPHDLFLSACEAVDHAAIIRPSPIIATVRLTNGTCIDLGSGTEIGVYCEQRRSCHDRVWFEPFRGLCLR